MEFALPLNIKQQLIDSTYLMQATILIEIKHLEINKMSFIFTEVVRVN